MTAWVLIILIHGGSSYAVDGIATADACAALGREINAHRNDIYKDAWRCKPYEMAK